MSGFRQLTSSEISLLNINGCICDTWEKIQVKDKFQADRYRNVIFSGTIKLGNQTAEYELGSGIIQKSGIYNARIHNVTIGEDVCISNVGDFIANYDIADNVEIINVDRISVEGETSFGNGVKIAVLNEGGGREIPIFNELSAQTAYIMAVYRHETTLVSQIAGMIEDYVAQCRSNIGKIGRNTKIHNCGSIINSNIGEGAKLSGVKKLFNGSINSQIKSPVEIGDNVIAEGFIICSDSKITDGVIIDKCFIGQGCRLGKQYSAENSVFFANCQGFHGEACSIFAGPFTVTHHKSTLLIAGLFSFLNAGSGSNQSNHMYKLGPVHQGIVERGSKTASDSYVLWPAKIGPFTLIMGRHNHNPDTSDLPFSYMIEHDNESVLIPAVNLRSVGTVRDARKWPKRDNRSSVSKRLDQINFNLLSPYTVQKMIKGKKILEQLKKISGSHSEYFTYNNVRINNRSVSRGIHLYETGIIKFLGNMLISRLEKCRSKADFLKIQSNDSKINNQNWIDLAGLLVPEYIISKTFKDIKNGNILNIAKLNNIFRDIHNEYYEYAWQWSKVQLETLFCQPADQWLCEDITGFIDHWIKAVAYLDDILYQDAGKEFGTRSMIGFGKDGTTETKGVDFEAVRGTFEDNAFVNEIRQHIETKKNIAAKVIAKVEILWN